MAIEWQVQSNELGILLGLAINAAVLDVLTDRETLAICLKALSSQHHGLVSVSMGKFGGHPVTLNLHPDGSTSIFVDGHAFNSTRSQSAAIWVGKSELVSIIQKVVQAEQFYGLFRQVGAPEARAEFRSGQRLSA